MAKLHVNLCAENRLFTTLVLLLGLLIQHSVQASSPVVKTSSGAFQGELLAGSNIYRGIPYAQSPVGELRWQPPQAVPKWQGTHAATSIGAPCPQHRRSGQVASSEDCLSLNIGVPAGASGLPVLFSIHGGGFVGGSGAPMLATAPLFNSQGIILVTFNYRLGALGFFAHPELDAPQGVNFALMDMVAALKWVHQNIAAFGGDPGRITIQGVSAGGKAVDMLMVSPESAGFFAAAIAQSGYGAWPLQPRVATLPTRGMVPSAEGLAMLIAARAANKDEQDVTRGDLYALPPQRLVAAIKGFHLPIVDGVSLLEESAILFAQGRQHPVPFMAGGTSFDGSVYPASGVSAATLKNLAMGSESEQKALWHSDYTASPEQGNKRFFGDIRYLYSAWNMTRGMANVKQAGYLYLFDYLEPAQRGKAPGAGHGSDARALWRDYSSPTAATMRAYWLNFIKTGNPNAAQLPQWDVAADEEDTHWMVFASTVKSERNLKAGKMAYLDRLWRVHAKLPDAAIMPLSEGESR